MSIQIGVNAKTSSTSITNNERIFLQSSVHSNMISLKSPLIESRLWFDDDLTFGRSNNSFAFSKNDVPFVIFNSNQNIFKSPVLIDERATFASDVAVNTNLYVHNDVISSGVQTCNVKILTQPSSTSPVFTIENGNTVLLSSFPSGVTYTSGSIGIGTTVPTAPLHVIGDIISSGKTRASNVITEKIGSYLPGTEIDMTSLSNIYLRGNVVITETLEVIGGISQNITQVQYLYVDNGLTSPFISLSNIAHNENTINILQNLTTTTSPCNIMDINVYDGEEYSALTMSPYGRFGIGTDTPNASFQVQYLAKHGTSNMVSFNGLSPFSNITIDNNANVGIGTTLPRHNLHIHRDDTSVVNSNAIFALYNHTTRYNAPLVAAFSNNTQVLRVSETGNLTIGNIPTNDKWGVDISSSLRAPLIQCASLVADPIDCNIHMYKSHLSNVGNYTGQNMKVTEFVSTCNLVTDYFFSSNYEIPGFQIFNTPNYLAATMQSTLFKGSNVVFSPNDADIYWDPITYGKVRIYAADALTADGTSVGLSVIGNTNTIAQITSRSQPIFKLIATTSTDSTEAVMKLENNAFRFTHSKTSAGVLPLQVNDKGMLLYRNIFIDNFGRMGLKLGGTDLNPTSPEYPFQMKGTAYFQSDVNSSPIMFLNGANARIGVNTIDPLYTLHVAGSSLVASQSYFQDRMSIGLNVPPSSYMLYVNGSQYVSSNVIVNSNVGIGTTNPKFKLDVWGDINFTGDLYQRNSPYVSSQWTTSNAKIYIMNSNVGIGTSNAATLLDVRGTAHATSVGVGTTVPLQSFHVVNQSFFNSNVGIGVSIPLGSLHVNYGPVLLNGSVGIGTTIPKFPLHVRGDLNFDGDLFQNGNKYVSSQWTSKSPGSIFIENSNVGIGTSTPLYGLHVTLPCMFTSNVTFDSNVAVNGLLSTRGNIASISDQKVKDNLVPISNPLDRIQKLTGYTYDRIDNGRREAGLIAQQVQNVMPEVVFPLPQDDMLTISYGNLAGLFVEAFKELNTKITTLQDEIAQLKLGLS